MILSNRRTKIKALKSLYFGYSKLYSTPFLMAWLVIWKLKHRFWGERIWFQILSAVTQKLFIISNTAIEEPGNIHYSLPHQHFAWEVPITNTTSLRRKSNLSNRKQIAWYFVFPIWDNLKIMYFPFIVTNRSQQVWHAFDATTKSQYKEPD